MGTQSLQFIATHLQYLHVGPLNLRVPGGSCLALVGRSGSGKSVALRMMADLVPHAGTCRLDGVAASDVPARQWRTWIRYVAAEAGWWAPRVDQHFRNPSGLGKSLARLRLEPKLLTAPPAHLSTGERQRLAFLRALEGGPRVLLLDEPTAALDAEAVLAVEDMVKEHMERGGAAIMTSHDPAQLERLADQIVNVEGDR